MLQKTTIAETDREQVIARFDQVVRRPEEFGGVQVLGELLDRLAQVAQEAGEEDPEDWYWMPDWLIRDGGSYETLRQGLPDPLLRLTAFQYCDDAHRRGWLRPDRVLTFQERLDLGNCIAEWIQVDHDEHEILAKFGPPSLVIGGLDPQEPKALCYVGADREQPVIGFHLGAASLRTDGEFDETGDSRVRLFGVSFDDYSIELTPHGAAYRDALEAQRLAKRAKKAEKTKEAK